MNQPLLANIHAGNNGQDSYSFACVNAGNVILETVKRAEDENGTIIRMYESENSLTKAKVTVNADFTKAYVCNLLEETESEAEVNGKEISVVLKPYEVVTLKLV